VYKVPQPGVTSPYSVNKTHAQNPDYSID